MKFPFREQLLNEKKSYADATPAAGADVLDCSLGVNPYGCPPAAGKALAAFDPAGLSAYPHSRVLHRAIVAAWSPYGPVEEREVALCNGSMGALYAVNNLFSQSVRTQVAGFIPSFTDMVESVFSFGMTYRGVPLRLQRGGAAAVEDLMAVIGPDTALVYIDRPHNPTGQTMPLSDVARLLAAAREAGCYVLADEAYGDFIPRAESAITLRGEFDNLIVARTFSKGYGLANLRGGYLLAPADVTAMLARCANPYILGDLNREVFAAALADELFPASHGADFAAAKAELSAVTGRRVVMLETDGRVPVCTLGLTGPGDLQRLLLEQGVLAVSGREFELLDERYVRLRLPVSAEVPRLLAAIRRVNESD